MPQDSTLSPSQRGQQRRPAKIEFHLDRHNPSICPSKTSSVNPVPLILARRPNNYLPEFRSLRTRAVTRATSGALVELRNKSVQIFLRDSQNMLYCRAVKRIHILHHNVQAPNRPLVVAPAQEPGTRDIRHSSKCINAILKFL